MALTDPIADMLTRVRNANIAYLKQVDIPDSKIKEQIAGVLKKEGFIKEYQVINTGVQGVLRLFMKYGAQKEKVITGLKRISKCGRRVYVGKNDIPRIFGGLGVVIMTTPSGVMTGKQAKKTGIGGEVLAYVW
ncbi:MAG: 30S ribosomal protein S8 [Candidatus Eremiobacteraeota bacterium]|nr:30S ribosomal protein S8 [Candidatus Eremiobacteraeota bacterium]